MSKENSMGMHVRWMIRRDMPEVLNIEKQSFEFAWDEDDFVRCLRQRNCIGMVVDSYIKKMKRNWIGITSEVEEYKVLGFMIYELHKNRIHLINFAIHPDFRRIGVGKIMVEKLMNKLYIDRRNRILIEVRESNLEAQLFFQAMGFRAISVLRDFYVDTTEDAYLMQVRLMEDSLIDSQ